MKYFYATTKDFNVGEDWIIFSQNNDNVRFRFIVETYSRIVKSVWMSPAQAKDYICFRADYVYRGYTIKIVKRVLI